MTTREEAIAAAAEVYRNILANPERAAAIREHRKQLAEESDRSAERKAS